VKHLGEANWQSYVRLKEMAAAEHPVKVTALEAVVLEIPESAFRAILQFHDSGLGTSAPSRSLYAASNASHASFISSATDSIKGKPRVPSTPMEMGKGKSFLSLSGGFRVLEIEWPGRCTSSLTYILTSANSLIVRVCSQNIQHDGFGQNPNS
jgi:hypothetical protein